MNIEEKKAKLAFMQKFFFMSFLVSFIILLISSFLCVALQGFQNDLVENLFGVSAETTAWLVVLILGLWKVLIIQFTLIPGIAVWLLRKFCKHKCDVEEHHH